MPVHIKTKNQHKWVFGTTQKTKNSKKLPFFRVVKMSKHDSMHTIFLSFISDDQDILSKKYLQLFLNNRTVLPAGNFKKKNDEPSFPV